MVAMPIYAATATGTVAPKPVAMASMTPRSGGVLWLVAETHIYR